MRQSIVTMTAADIDIAIDLIARRIVDNGSHRHPDWIRRRLREAVRFVSENGPEHPDYRAYIALAEPVLSVAAQLNGDVERHNVN